MLQAKLVVVSGEAITKEVQLKLPATIGRGREVTLQMQHALVSREHCLIYEAGGRLWVKDLGSTNGTLVNNQRITEAELPPNELLTIGTVTFRAEYTPLAFPAGIPPAIPTAVAGVPSAIPLATMGTLPQAIPTAKAIPVQAVVPVDESKTEEFRQAAEGDLKDFLKGLGK